MSNFKLNLSNIEQVENELRDLAKAVEYISQGVIIDTNSNEYNKALRRLSTNIKNIAKNIRLTASFLDFYVQDMRAFDNSLDHGSMIASNYAPFSIRSYMDAINSYKEYNATHKMCSTNYLSGTVAWNGKPANYMEYISGYLTASKHDYGLNGSISTALYSIAETAGYKYNSVNSTVTNKDGKPIAKKVHVENSTPANNNKTPLIYKVTKEESLDKIANTYGISKEDLYNANKDILDSPESALEIGMTLLLPGKYITKVYNNNEKINNEWNNSEVNLKEEEKVTNTEEKYNIIDNIKEEQTIKTVEQKHPDEIIDEPISKKTNESTKIDAGTIKKEEVTKEVNSPKVNVNSSDYTRYTQNLHAKKSCSSSNAATIGVITTNNQKYTVVSGNGDCKNYTMSKADYNYIVATMCVEASGISDYQDAELLAVASCILNQNESKSENFGSSWNRLVANSYTKWEDGSYQKYMPGGSSYNSQKVQSAQAALDLALAGVRNVGPNIMYNVGNGTYNKFGDTWK